MMKYMQKCENLQDSFLYLESFAFKISHFREISEKLAEERGIKIVWKSKNRKMYYKIYILVVPIK